MIQSPIYAAERRHQRYVIQSNRSSTVWIWVAILMMVPAMLTALTITVIALFWPDVGMNYRWTSNPIQNNLVSGALVLMLAMNIAHTLVLGLVSSGLAADSIQREHRHKTWDLLLLTGQSARAIARGKIVAAFWTLRRDLLMVVILRLGLVSVSYLTARQIPFLIGGIMTNSSHLLMLIIITTLWTVIDSFTAVALAVAGAALPARARLTGSLVGLLVRIGLMISGVVWLVTVFGTMNGAPDSPTYLVLGVIGLLVYVIFAYISVWLAEFALRTAGASARPLPFTPPPTASTNHPSVVAQPTP